MKLSNVICTVNKCEARHAKIHEWILALLSSKTFKEEIRPRYEHGLETCWHHKDAVTRWYLSYRLGSISSRWRRRDRLHAGHHRWGASTIFNPLSSAKERTGPWRWRLGPGVAPDFLSARSRDCHLVHRGWVFYAVFLVGVIYLIVFLHLSK